MGLGGRIHATFAPEAFTLPLLQDGRLLVLAVADEEPIREPIAIPTAVSEHVDYRIATWYGFLASAKTPTAIVATVHELDDLRERLLPVGKQRLAWAKMAAILVAAQLREPSSELHIAQDWYRPTALSDLLQLGDQEIDKDHLYRGLDHLLARKAARAQRQPGHAARGCRAVRC